MKENTGQVLVQAPVEIANYLLNEKRRALREIEQRHDAPIVIVADDQLETPALRSHAHPRERARRRNQQAQLSARHAAQAGDDRADQGQPQRSGRTRGDRGASRPACADARAARRNARAGSAPPRGCADAGPAGAASGGFVGWLKGLFGGEAAPVVVPARGERPQHEGRGGGRNERNDRGGQQRRDGRNGGRPQGSRDGVRRDEPRRNQGQAAAPQAGEPAQNKPQRQQQQQQQQKPQKQNPPRQKQPRPGQQDAPLDVRAQAPVADARPQREPQDVESQKRLPLLCPRRPSRSSLPLPQPRSRLRPKSMLPKRLRSPPHRTTPIRTTRAQVPKAQANRPAAVVAVAAAVAAVAAAAPKVPWPKTPTAKMSCTATEVAAANRSQPEFDFDDDDSVARPQPAPVCSRLTSESSPRRPPRSLRISLQRSPGRTGVGDPSSATRRRADDPRAASAFVVRQDFDSGMARSLETSVPTIVAPTAETEPAAITDRNVAATMPSRSTSPSPRISVPFVSSTPDVEPISGLCRRRRRVCGRRSAPGFDHGSRTATRG